MTLLIANSLVDGFMSSNFIGKGIVVAQLVFSVVMLASFFGKWRDMNERNVKMRRFLRDFSSSDNVLEYYIQRRSAMASGVEAIYKDTCERLLALMAPETRLLLAGRQPEGGGALLQREVELVSGTCQHALDEEVLAVEYGMGAIATGVALEPMLGLLGTVWGVLDAFAAMGTAASTNLATIAPAISSALVTTVVGLLVAIPGVLAYNWLQASVRRYQSEMEGFADELMGRLACEYQGKGL